MISKELFCKAIEAILTQNAKEHRLMDALEQFPDSSAMVSFSGDVTSALKDVLSAGMEDEHDTIGWWLFDAPEGGKNESSAYLERHGMRFDLLTPAQLYDFLDYDRSHRSAYSV